MSRTDKDAPQSVKERREGRPTEPCGPTCGQPRTVERRARFMFRADEVAAIAALEALAAEKGWRIARRTEEFGYLVDRPDAAEGTEAYRAQLLKGRGYKHVPPPERSRWRHEFEEFRNRARLAVAPHCPVGEWPDLEEWAGIVRTTLEPMRAQKLSPQLWVEVALEKAEVREHCCWAMSNPYELDYGNRCTCYWCRQNRSAIAEKASRRSFASDVRDGLEERAASEAEQRRAAMRRACGYEEHYEGVHGTHTMVAGRCVHCNCDDHSVGPAPWLPAVWEEPCPVQGPERVTSWSFGPGQNPFA